MIVTLQVLKLQKMVRKSRLIATCKIQRGSDPAYQQPVFDLGGKRTLVGILSLEGSRSHPLSKLDNLGMPYFGAIGGSD